MQALKNVDSFEEMPMCSEAEWHQESASHFHFIKIKSNVSCKNSYSLNFPSSADFLEISDKSFLCVPYSWTCMQHFELFPVNVAPSGWLRRLCLHIFTTQGQVQRPCFRDSSHAYVSYSINVQTLWPYRVMANHLRSSLQN